MRNCIALHETAEAEIEVWGKVMSGSIIDHLKECSFDLSQVDRPNRPACEQIGHVPTLAGRCAACGKEVTE